jgi:NADH:ubiquinone oxidoreductase subunit 3 (subunit A)
MNALKKYFDFSYPAILSAFLILLAASIGLFFVFSRLEDEETEEKKFKDYESALIAVSIGVVLAILILFGFK